MTALVKIYVVDDAPLFAEEISDYLSQNQRLEISTFTSGEACLAKMKKEPFMVVLGYNIDTLHKEASNGMAILDQIKKHNPLCHVIFLSAQESYGVAATSIARGAEQYVFKDHDAFRNIAQTIDELIK